MSQIVVVSGTGTDVGKTIVTAALASNALADGRKVAVVKPGQTGVTADEPGDLATVEHLIGATDRLTTHELVRYEPALAPAAAARISDRPTLNFDAAADAITALTGDVDLVLVEGAGGLLVRYSDEPLWTIADLAGALDAPVLLVVHPALGTLHHTSATLEALAARSIPCAGLVIGSWPDHPGLAERSNLTDLPRLGTGLVGAVAEGASRLAPEDFASRSRGWLNPTWGGTFDAADFASTYEPEIPL